jgi:hypothetical protein
MRPAALVLFIWCVTSPGLGDCYEPQGRCEVIFANTQITDNGDGDGFADTNETLRIRLTLETRNCATPPAHCVARLYTESSAIDCMPRAEISLGNLPVSGPPVTPEQQFEVKIGDVDRQGLGLGPDDPLEARLFVEIDCADARSRLPGEIRLPLDLNVSDRGQAPATWFEGFESETLGRFEPQNNDAGIPGSNDAEGLINGDGWRCQYTDPDWENSSSYNQPNYSQDCYPGVNMAQADAVFWQIDGHGVAASPDGGRAFGGTRSMHYGVFVTNPVDGFTTPLSTVEAAGTPTLINLGVDNPKLSFWHQISLSDHRTIQASDRRSADRGAVQIKLFEEDGDEASPWMNLQAIQNGYDEQNADNFFNCEFDPVDDGNNEDDFFDPTDPEREHGPSSTCFPEFTWAWMGSTTGAFDVANVGHATTAPAGSDTPNLGDGTWIETVVDLSQFRGRRAKLRFIVTSIKAGAYLTVFDASPWWNPPAEGDDGWWVDDVRIDETLAEPAEFINDTFLLGSCSGTGVPCIEQCRTSLEPCSAAAPCGAGAGDCVMPCPLGEVCTPPAPDCGPDCSEVQANLFVEPAELSNPESVTALYGDSVCLNAAATVDVGTGAEPSRADSCVSGYLEYRYCISGDPDAGGEETPDADCNDAWDLALPATPWSLDFVTTVSPEATTTYAMVGRCSSAPGCRAARSVEVVVDCPSGDPNTSGLKVIRALNKEMLAWSGVLDVDWLRGSFVRSAEIGHYSEELTDSATAATSIPMNGEPPPGTGYYYLIKRDGFANPFGPPYECDSVTWRSGGAAEKPEPARNFAFGNP